MYLQIYRNKYEEEPIYNDEVAEIWTNEKGEIYALKENYEIIKITDITKKVIIKVY